MTTSNDEKTPFFSFPHPMNSSVARVVAGGVVIMSVATILLNQPWITLLILYGFIARVAAGPRISPLAILVTKVIVPKFKLPYRPVAGPPKRFSAGLGVAFSATAAILSLAFGLNGAAYGVLGGLIFAAGLESIFGICVGCYIFGLLIKAGIIPESVCEECANFELRVKRMADQGLRPDGTPLSN
ncbi:MAG: MFS transporter permease [Chloroflexi bacterium]|nr:MFS transporter permease [Chloroflexota bacterium]|tara:strand:+ start:3632 stop:4186 length:555 start_codon:yes stop_codon:yes gene_type:complete